MSLQGLPYVSVLQSDHSYKNFTLRILSAQRIAGSRDTAQDGTCLGSFDKEVLSSSASWTEKASQCFHQPAHAADVCHSVTSRFCSDPLSPYEGTTNRLAAFVAHVSKPKDCLCLYGDVGAGKSVFSRAFIRAIADDQDLPVPSPTYLLQNTYEEHDGPLVHHFDLYRLSGPAELGRLQLEDAFNSGICLIEWAERLGSSAPADHLQIHIELLSEEDEERIRGMQGMRELIDQASSFQEEPADVDPEEEENAYCDKRWRRVVLTPKGIAWMKRIGKLAQALMDQPDQGLLLLSPVSQR